MSVWSELTFLVWDTTLYIVVICDETVCVVCLAVDRLRPLVVGSLGPYGAFVADGSEYTGSYVDKLTTQVPSVNLLLFVCNSSDNYHGTFLHLSMALCHRSSLIPHFTTCYMHFFVTFMKLKSCITRKPLFNFNFYD